MNAHLHAAHLQPSRRFFAQLLDAADALPGAVATTDRLAHDLDPIALERLERLAERFDGLRRLSLQARESLRLELDGQTDAALPPAA